MPRPPKPYVHRGWWVTNVGGKRHKLCGEEAGRTAAFDAFCRLYGQRPLEDIRTFTDLRVDQLIVLFLDTVKIEKSESTYHNYQRWLIEFAKQHELRLVTQISRQDALKFRNDIASSTWTSVRLTRGHASETTKAKLKSQPPKRPSTMPSSP